MASAVLAMSVHPSISDDEVDNHVYMPEELDLAGLGQAIQELCKGGSEFAKVRIADTYLDYDSVGEIQQRSGMVEAVKSLGDIMMNQSSVPGKSRKGLISVSDEWSRELKRDVRGPQLAPSVFFIMVRASTSLTVGDWLHQAMAYFDSFPYPPSIIEAFTGKKSTPSAGRLPSEIEDKLVSMFGLPFERHAKLQIVCRRN